MTRPTRRAPHSRRHKHAAACIAWPHAGMLSARCWCLRRASLHWVLCASAPHACCGLVQGVYKQLVEVFRSQGVESAPGEGSSFDPAVHDAIMREEDDSVADGTVLQVRPCFLPALHRTLHERVPGRAWVAAYKRTACTSQACVNAKEEWCAGHAAGLCGGRQAHPACHGEGESSSSQPLYCSRSCWLASVALCAPQHQPGLPAGSPCSLDAQNDVSHSPCSIITFPVCRCRTLMQHSHLQHHQMPVLWRMHLMTDARYVQCGRCSYTTLVRGLSRPRVWGHWM